MKVSCCWQNRSLDLFVVLAMRNSASLNELWKKLNRWWRFCIRAVHEFFDHIKIWSYRPMVVNGFSWFLVRLMHHFPGFGLHLKFWMLCCHLILHFITLNRDLPRNMLEDVFHQQAKVLRFSWRAAGARSGKPCCMFRVVRVSPARTFSYIVVGRAAFASDNHLRKGGICLFELGWSLWTPSVTVP